MTKFENIVTGIEERIGLLTVARPQALNALNSATLTELEELFESWETEDAVGAIILTGAGEKSFVAGADITELAAQDPITAENTARRGQTLFDRIESFPKPVIAAVNGYCLGGGCELAMACHMRIASEKAVFGQPEVKLGIIPGYGGTQRLTRLVGKGLAMEIILGGEMVSAQRALQIGLANRVVAPDKLLEECRSLAGKILQNGPLALRYSIEAINRGANMPLKEALAFEASLFGLIFSSQDMQEGTSAFLEKRKAEFKGR